MTGEDWEDIEEESVDDAEIQDILDEGYAILDGFMLWLEEALLLDTRSAQQDLYNAEALLEYVAERERKPLEQMSEFDFRWFFYFHYIRTALSDQETQQRLPESLRRFVEYLRQERMFEVPEWLYEALDERGAFQNRWEGYHKLTGGDEVEWLAGYREWCADLENDLDMRCLWLPKDMGDGLFWGDTMGWREGTLLQTAKRLWMRQRDALIEQGLTFEEMRHRLADSYYLWLDTPQARLDEYSPKQTILYERRDRAEDEEGER